MGRYFSTGLLVLAFVSRISVIAPDGWADRQGPTVVTKSVAQHEHLSKHPCCQRPAGFVRTLSPLAPMVMPCGNQHLCCVRSKRFQFPKVVSPRENQRPAWRQAGV